MRDNWHWQQEFDESESNRSRKRTSDYRQHIVYRFVSPDRQSCYFGITTKPIEQRIAEHCEDANSALFGHLSGFKSDVSTIRPLFEEIDAAIGYKAAEEKESEMILDSLLLASLDDSKPVPLNRMTHNIPPYEFKIMHNRFLAERQHNISLLERTRRTSAKDSEARQRLQPLIRRYLAAKNFGDADDMKYSLHEMNSYFVKRKQSEDALKMLVLVVFLIIFLVLYFGNNSWRSCDCDSANNWCCYD